MALLDRVGATVGDGPLCTSCPLCRWLSRVKTDDPQVATELTDAITDTAAGLVRLLSIVAPRGGAPNGAESNAADPAGPRDVQRVPVTETEEV